MDNSPIFLSAGDPSGDTAASLLLSELKKARPGWQYLGLGGPRLKRAGQSQLADAGDLAVLGFWEVAKRYPYFRRLLATCVRRITETKPRAVILVDYPGFNLRLARKIRHLNIPIIYYISPQVWAWGKRRIPAIKRLVDLMMVILPFEEDFYSGHGMESQFVGHYLLEDIPAEFISSDTPDHDAPALTLLPGSRPQEIQRMLPVMLQAAAEFNRKQGTRAVVGGISDLFDYEPYLAPYRSAGIDIVYDNARAVIYNSRLVVTASGTATLETAIIGRPMVVIYKTGFLTYMIARKLVRLDKIALVNIVLGEKAVPELIQHRATAESIGRELDRFVVDREHYDGVKSKLAGVPSLLGGRGGSLRAAQRVIECIER